VRLDRSRIPPALGYGEISTAGNSISAGAAWRDCHFCNERSTVRSCTVNMSMLHNQLAFSARRIGHSAQSQGWSFMSQEKLLRVIGHRAIQYFAGYEAGSGVCGKRKVLTSIARTLAI
jgi:hypothetical protein